jgi:hypothetical protein
LKGVEFLDHLSDGQRLKKNSPSRNWLVASLALVSQISKTIIPQVGEIYFVWISSGMQYTGNVSTQGLVPNKSYST